MLSHKTRCKTLVEEIVVGVADSMDAGDFLVEVVPEDVDVNFLGGRDEDCVIVGLRYCVSSWRVNTNAIRH